MLRGSRSPSQEGTSSLTASVTAKGEHTYKGICLGPLKTNLLSRSTRNPSDVPKDCAGLPGMEKAKLTAKC